MLVSADQSFDLSEPAVRCEHITGTMRGQGVRMGRSRAQAGGTDDGGSATGSPSDKPGNREVLVRAVIWGILQSITVSKASNGSYMEEKALRALGSVGLAGGSVKIQKRLGVGAGGSCQSSV